MGTVRDIMNTRVVGIRPDATLAQAVAILTQQHIGGAPVVTAEGAVVGVISELALIDVVFDSDAKDSPVSEYMTPEVHTVHPDDPLSRPAQLFALYSFRRLPVVQDGKLVGIVTRRDLMNYALRANELLTDPLIELIPSLAPMT
ncbi:MAG TPA: CBS domain-containing protein [Lacipirellulaceae bacterium]|jgi:CBS domain-containing protein|nr:CBS domain-containing protein [Lacipirellulaceae bacterium]